MPNLPSHSTVSRATTQPQLDDLDRRFQTVQGNISFFSLSDLLALQREHSIPRLSTQLQTAHAQFIKLINGEISRRQTE